MINQILPFMWGLVSTMLEQHMYMYYVYSMLADCYLVIHC